MIIDRFSAGLDEMKRKDQRDPVKVLAVLDRIGRFSCFEASENATIARVMTDIMHHRYGRWIEVYTPESYKSKPEPGGARAPDQDTYPWTYVKITEEGRKALSAEGKHP